VKNIILRVIAVLLGFSVALGLAEIAVRYIRPQEVGPPRFALDPKLGEIPVPRQQARRFYPGVYDYTYSNNSLGFRGDREYGPKKPGDFRILLLGDSFTYGLGVNDDQTFAFHLEQYLRQHSLAAEVINAGCPGKGTDYELKLFQTLGVKLHPDLTVLCFFPNDFEDNARGEYFDLQPDGGLRVNLLESGREGLKTFLFRFPGYNWLISWSHAANLVKKTAVDYLVSRRNDPGGSASAVGVPEGPAPAAADLVVSYSYTGQRFSDDASKKVTEIYLAHLMEAVKQDGSDLAFIYIPNSSEVEAYRRTQEASPDEMAIKALIEARGEALYSLTPVLAVEPRSVRDLYLAEGHWTRRAHLLVGNNLGNYLNHLIQEKLKR